MRSPGDLNAPLARPPGAAGNNGDPNASTPAAPGSSSIALTPVRKNPSARGSGGLPRDAVVMPAAESSGPWWHRVHCEPPAAELVEALLLDRRQGAGIASEKTIDRRVVAHECGLVRLHGEAEEQAEVVRHLAELAGPGRLTGVHDHAGRRHRSTAGLLQYAG